ncbi:MAG: hypothetical protein APF81_25445 [Desulfosporosinus sp. BRH_c37]|nr:MAG: hypothetical protein APF81_25445 [Desulfosporosinus sp. BRH_c37]
MSTLENNVYSFLIEYFRTGNRNAIEIVSQNSDGKSGALVYSLHVKHATPKNREGYYILKLSDTRSIWYDSSDNEATKSSRAEQHANQFASRIAHTITSKEIDGKLVQIIHYALHSRINSVCAEKLKHEALLPVLEMVSEELLTKWNDDYMSCEAQSENVLAKWLSYRLKSESTGQGSVFFNRICRLLERPQEPAFHYDGQFYPNPFYYVENYKILQGLLDGEFLTGKLHADLHLKNLFISQFRNTTDFCLIDFDTYQDCNYLFFDHAYLEFSVLQRLYEKNPIDDWILLLRHGEKLSPLDMVRNEEYECLRGEQVRNSIAKGIAVWSKSERSSTDAVQLQFLLAKVAVGINYLCKKKIEEDTLLKKALFYAAIHLNTLFNLTKYDWNKKDGGPLKDEVGDEGDIWDACDELRTQYIKVLLTDDIGVDSYETLSPITAVNWSFIADIGWKNSSDDLFGNILPKIKAKRNVCVLDKNSDIAERIQANSCFWLDAKYNEEDSLSGYAREYRKKALQAMKISRIASPLKPILLIVACQSNPKIVSRYLQWFFEDGVFDSNMRAVFMGKELDDDIAKELDALKIPYRFFRGRTLIDMANVFKSHGIVNSNAVSTIKRSIPGKQRNVPIGDLDLAYWNGSLDVVYTGIEGEGSDYDYGRSFYRGNEITWADLANNVDIIMNVSTRPDNKENYEQVLFRIKDKLDKNEVDVEYLFHGAGAGGTTYARRLLWDLKDAYPCTVIKKYSSETENILCDIYRKTGQPVFVIAEIGASVISEDDVYLMANQINKNSCRALILCVMRYGNHQMSVDTEKRKVLLNLPTDMPLHLAKLFLEKYAPLAKDQNCVQALRSITDDQSMREQKCPFFYGFYALQDEYIGVNDFLEKILNACSDECRDLLADLCIVTCYSQTLTIPYTEVMVRLGLSIDKAWRISTILGSSVLRILSSREEGYRICDQLIARKLLEINFHVEQNERIYRALIGFIDHKHTIYGAEESYTNEAFKEILITRNDINNERPIFSDAITDVGKRDLQKNIFTYLIKLYPKNPYYYNHLGRLYANSYGYPEAIDNLEKAIRVAQESGRETASHNTTLGWIYYRQVDNWLKINITRINRQSKKLSDVFNAIEGNFNKACDAFQMARDDNKFSTYSYVPQINMITKVLNRIVQCFGEIKTLLNDEQFSEWYDENIGLAIRLYQQMGDNCGEEQFALFRESCLNHILEAQHDIEALRRKQRTVRSPKTQMGLNRAISSLILATNKFDMGSIKPDEIAEIEKLMYVNIQSGKALDSDVFTWFNAYRRLPTFDIPRTIDILKDSLQESHKKYYYLFMLYFLLYEKGLVGSNAVDVNLTQCQNYSRKAYGLKTAKVLDAYFSHVKGCSVLPMTDLKRDQGEWDTSPLKAFTGKIKIVKGNTEGRASIDGLDMDVFFAPIVYSRNQFSNQMQRIYYSPADEGGKVSFKLMFSLDGPKAWSVERMQ